MMTVNEAIETLRYGGLRVRTALWLLPIQELTNPADKAARLGISWADARQPILNTIVPEQHFLQLGLKELLEALDSLCSDHKATDCLLIANWDLLVAKLGSNDRKEMWEILYSRFPHRPRSLILIIPEDAYDLLPSERQLAAWEKEGRLAR